MQGLFGFQKTDPMLVYNRLASNCIFDDFYIKTLEAKQQKVDVDVYANIYLVLTVKTFMQYADKLEKEKCVVIIFDCVEILKSLKNIILFDKQAKLIDLPQTIIKALKAKKKQIKVEFKQKNEIEAILATKKNSGFINNYNTLLYKISNKILRENIRALIFKRMENKIKAPYFSNSVKKMLPVRGKTMEAIVSLTDLVNGQEGDRLREAIAEAISTKADTNVIASKYKVEGFDIRYFMAVIDKAKNNVKVTG